MAHTIGTPIIAAAFVAVVVLLLMIDLGVLHRPAHAVKLREALLWSCVWVLLSVSFGLWVYRKFGPQPGLEFFAGYLIEYALSVAQHLVQVEGRDHRLAGVVENGNLLHASAPGRG